MKWNARGTSPKLPVLLLAVIALAAGGPSPAAWGQPATAAAAPYACNQPMPSPAPGQVTLAGLGYGPYHAGQNPNLFISPSAAEVAADMPTLAAVTNYIRIYSSRGPAADILRAAGAAHLCVALGIWLGRDARANTAEIAAGIRLARQSPVRSVIVGNEVLHRGDLPVARLLRDIRAVRAALGHRVAISYADEFGQWLAHPELAKAVDFITVHIYPFWQMRPIGSAISVLSRDYAAVVKRYPRKPVVIGETGWPSGGPRQGRAVPSPANQARYFRGFAAWAKKHAVPYFYFDAFDEGWKTSEFGVGTHWGLYDQAGHRKPALARWLPAASPPTIAERAYRDVFVGSRLETPFNLGIDTSGHRRHWLTATHGVLTMAYPGSQQQWGAMFITVGKPARPGHRQSINLSHYRSLSADLRAGADGERIRLGIKDRSQPDNGSEITVEETLTTHWSTVALPLSLFANVSKRHLYVVLEVVFLGDAPERVQLRNLRYSPATVPPPAFPPAQMPFPVYTDGFDPANHYVASGFMGDVRSVTMNQTWARDPHGGRTCIKVTYRASGRNRWAGVYWQNPVDNWGKIPGPTGYDLSHARRLTFWVRGRTGHEHIQFLAGGITGKHGDSLRPALKTPWLKLSRSWRQVTINLTGRNLTHIIGGFGWVASIRRDPAGTTFYLDDIIYSS